MSANKRILILIDKYTSEKDRNWTFFRDAVQSHIGDDVEIQMGALHDLVFELNDERDDVYDRERRFSLGDFDLVVFRFIRDEHARAAACASYLQGHAIPYIDSHIHPSARSKYSAEAVRRSAGLRVIPSVFSSNRHLVSLIEAGELPFGYPIIIKDVNGRKGKLNYLANSADEAVAALRANPDTEFIIQKCIPNDGDYRVLIMGGRIVLVIHRRAVGDSHLNNTSQGAVSQTLDPMELDEAIASDALRAASLEGLDVAGVDVIIDKGTDEHYILEVNSSPQLATGAVPERKLQAYTDYLRSLIA